MERALTLRVYLSIWWIEIAYNPTSSYWGEFATIVIHVRSLISNVLSLSHVLKGRYSWILRFSGLPSYIVLIGRCVKTDDLGSLHELCKSRRREWALMVLLVKYRGRWEWVKHVSLWLHGTMLSHFILVCLDLVLVNEVEVGVPVLNSVMLLLREGKLDIVFLFWWLCKM
jgi:hypothetical protein